MILGGWQQSGGSGNCKQPTYLLSTPGVHPRSDVGIPGDQGFFRGRPSKDGNVVSETLGPFNNGG